VSELWTLSSLVDGTQTSLVSSPTRPSSSLAEVVLARVVPVLYTVALRLGSEPSTGVAGAAIIDGVVPSL
jgi:hypothetical protein